MNADLDRAILAAHDTGDRPALIRLYTNAAEASGDIDAQAYFLTIAYVYALEGGAPEAGPLYARLRSIGREH